MNRIFIQFFQQIKKFYNFKILNNIMIFYWTAENPYRNTVRNDNLLVMNSVRSLPKLYTSDNDLSCRGPVAYQP